MIIAWGRKGILPPSPLSKIIDVGGVGVGDLTTLMLDKSSNAMVFLGLLEGMYIYISSCRSKNTRLLLEFTQVFMPNVPGLLMPDRA